MAISIIVSQWRALSPRVEADVAAEEQKMREAFAERKRQVELKKAQRLKDEEARLAAEALQAATSEAQPRAAQEPLQPSVAQAQPPTGSIESIKAKTAD